MSRSGSRRLFLRPVPLAAVAVTATAAAAIVTGMHAAPNGSPVTLRDAADAADAAAGLQASYQAGTSWGTGYSGQYTILNNGPSAVTSWTLVFRLPAGTTVSSLWDGSYTASGGLVTVTDDSWDATISPGGTATVGFVTESAGTAGQPGSCTINGAPCAGGSGTVPSTSPTAVVPTTGAPVTAPPVPSASATPSLPPASPTVSPTVAPTGTSGSPSAGAAGFAPYVDATLYPPFSLVSTARATGVKQFNLAFVVAAGGSGCTPEWGGGTALGSDPVAAQIGALRAIGGDVRISFGGQAGSELASTCTSVSQLQAAYQQVISAYGVNKIDFDIEGATLKNTAANALRDQALAALEAADPGLQVSFTLPVLPSGLTAAGNAVLTGAVQAGVKISAVDVMAMDYGDGAVANPAGQMGTFAIEAATAADAQVASALKITDAAAWSKIAVTPMIGVNDITDEIFTVANAQQLAAFAASKHLAWLSMWSAARDTECAGGARASTSNSCSSVVQTPDEFMDALGAY